MDQDIAIGRPLVSGIDNPGNLHPPGKINFLLLEFGYRERLN
jgi:hypothetical protein